MTKPSARLIAADSAILVGIGLLALSPLRDAYGGWRWSLAAGGGIALGLLTAFSGLRLRLGPILTALAAFVIYLVLGPALAVPEIATARFLPDPEALRALLTGLVNAWRDSLTLVTPLRSTGTVLVVPCVTGLVLGAAGGSLLWRTKRAGAVGFLVISAFILAAAFGARETAMPVARGLVLTVALLIWMRWRATRAARVSWPRRLALTAVVVSIAGGLGVGLTTATAGQARDVLRDYVDPPFDPLDYPSPLSRYRAYYDDKGLADKVLFTTTGLTPGDHIRLATMDTFDGIVWNVAGGPTAPTQSGSFGRFIPKPTRDDTDVTITIGDYTGPWVPTVGKTTDVRVSSNGSRDEIRQAGVLFNEATGTMAQLGGVQPGTTYAFKVEPSQEPAAPESLEADGSLSSAPPTDIPVLTKRVQKWVAAAGGPTGGALAKTLTDQFRLGYYSDGKQAQAQSASGHGIRRLVDLMTPDEMVGNDEQYASAMGVAAQLRGLPARVVMGFVIDDPSGAVKGKDVHAWVEVKLSGAGWVTFAPTPDKDRTPRTLQQDPQPEPQPNVLQPPVVPEEPDNDDEKAPQGAGRKNNESILDGLGTILRYLGYAAGAGALTSPIWLLLLAKLVRRRRRRNAADPIQRISGGWKEIADRARDLGTRLPPSNTRYESSVALAEMYPDSDVYGLALVADRHVFGPDQPTDHEVAAYWVDVDTALKRLRMSAPWWRRPLGVLNPASLPWRAVLRRYAMTGAVFLGRVWRSTPVRTTVGRLVDLFPAVRRKKVSQ